MDKDDQGSGGFQPRGAVPFGNEPLEDDVPSWVGPKPRFATPAYQDWLKAQTADRKRREAAAKVAREQKAAEKRQARLDEAAARRAADAQRREDSATRAAAETARYPVADPQQPPAYQEPAYGQPADPYAGWTGGAEPPVRRRGTDPAGGRPPVPRVDLGEIPSMAPAKKAGGGGKAIGCLAVLVVTGVAAWGVSAIGSHGLDSASAPNPPAQAAPVATTADPLAATAALLAGQDLADGHSHSAADYTSALTALAGQCTQGPAAVGQLVDNGLADERKNNVTDEDRLSLMQHLSQSMPSGSGPTDCVGIMAGYLVLREQ